jgi:hypothetical protein
MRLSASLALPSFEQGADHATRHPFSNPGFHPPPTGAWNPGFARASSRGIIADVACRESAETVEHVPSTVEETMSDVALRSRSHRRQIALSFVALAVLLMPDTAFSIVAETPWEVLILRMLTLLGVAVLAVLPWTSAAGPGVRRRLRIWSLPGVAATVIYLFAADPLYLIVGFCMLTGAALDMWTTRGAEAAENLMGRLGHQQRRHRR